MKPFAFKAGTILLGTCLCAAPAFAATEKTAAKEKAKEEYGTAADLKIMEGFPPPPDKRVDWSNALLTPPYNRWAYLHMREVYPTATIAPADEPVPVKKSIDKGLNDIKIKNPKTGKMVGMDTYLKETYTDALVVIKGDKIVYEKFLNGMGPNQPHQMMSATKSFAGLLALMAVQEGKLKETDRVTEYVPELKKSSAFSGATLGQVLNMTNCMEFTEDYADPRSGIRRYGAVLGWTEPVSGIKYEDNLYDFLVTLKTRPDCKDGEVFYYQTPKTDVVNWVTNRVTEQSFEDEMHDKLWSRLGTEGETYVLMDNNATAIAGGGLNASPYNLARFAIMMLNDGKFNGRQVVDPAVIKKISEGGSVKAFSKGPEAQGFQSGGDWSYRAQWWVRDTPKREAFMAIGINGQWIYIDEDRDIAIIKQSSQPVSKSDYFDRYTVNGFDAIIDYLSK